MSQPRTRSTALLIAVVLALTAGCARSPEAKKARYLERGDRYFKGERFREATIEYRNALRIDKNNPQAVRQLGFAHHQLGEVGQAFRFLVKVHDLEPENDTVAVRLATIYLLGRRPEAARAEADRVLTGGSRGIGAAVVEKLRSVGDRVAHTWKNNPGAGKDLALQADVRDAGAMEAVVDRVERVLRPVDGVVANAGITADAFLAKLSADAWRDVPDTNLTGVYNSLRPVVPRMHQRRAGAVVIISSIVGEAGNLGQTNYAASKAGVIGFTKALARESARFGVRVNAVAPGFIDTDMLKTIPESIRERLRSEIPLQRFGQPREVAEAIVFLLSSATSSFTGPVLRINGGHHR